MAMHLWLGRALCVLALVLLGLTGTARAGDVPSHPAAKPVPRDAKELFKNGVEIKARRDANVYITPQNFPKNDRYLKAYDADKAAKNKGSTAPGLLGIASQTYRSQGGAAPNKKAYSLADAMRDAVWRKKTAAKLKTLTSSRPPDCARKLAEIKSGSSSTIGLAGNC